MAKRRKAQARRGSERRIPLWMWLLGGMLLGLALAAALLIWNRDGTMALFPIANPGATAPRESEPAIAPAAKPETRPRPRYDFYTLLRERETRVSDKELADKVRAEASQQATPAAPAAATPPRERYLLQAGAFRTQRDADAIKARIAMGSGLTARVEAADVNGQPVYRVRLGPYATARELEDAKRRLAESGMPDTLAVRESLD